MKKTEAPPRRKTQTGTSVSVEDAAALKGPAKPEGARVACRDETLEGDRSGETNTQPRGGPGATGLSKGGCLF